MTVTWILNISINISLRNPGDGFSLEILYRTKNILIRHSVKDLCNWKKRDFDLKSPIGSVHDEVTEQMLETFEKVIKWYKLTELREGHIESVLHLTISLTLSFAWYLEKIVNF